MRFSVDTVAPAAVLTGCKLRHRQMVALIATSLMRARCLFRLLLPKLFHELVVFVHGREVRLIARLLCLLGTIGNFTYQRHQAFVARLGLSRIRREHAPVVRL